MRLFWLLDFLALDPDGVLVWFDMGAEVIRVNLGELRAEKKDLRGIINPKQERDERAGRAIRR